MTERTYLPRTPSKMTSKDIFLLINEKIEVMSQALDKTQTDSDNLEFAVKIQEIEDDLNVSLARSQDKSAMSRNMSEKSRQLNDTKKKILREIEEKKRIIMNYSPAEVHNTILKQLEQKITFTTYERDNFITHLNNEKLKLTDKQDIHVVENKINNLKEKFNEILYDLEKNTSALRGTKELENIVDFALSKFNRSVEAIHKQHDQALRNFNNRCTAIGIEPINQSEDLSMDPKVNYLTRELQRIEENIAKMRKIKEEAIMTLEKRKLELRNQPDADHKTEKNIEDTIKCITKEATAILDRMDDKKHQVEESKKSFDKLDTAITEMERELSRVQHEHDLAMSELQKKRDNIRDRLNSIEKLDLQINILTYKMYESQHTNRIELDELLKQRAEIIARVDLTESQMALLLAELDKKINDCRNTHEQTMLSLQGQKDEIEKESDMRIKNMDESMECLRANHVAMLQELECQKLNATPSQLILINRKIAELQAQFESDMAELQRLQSLGWKELNSEERLAALLEVRGLRVTKSGRILTKSGQLLTLEEAECLGLLEGIQASWDVLKPVKFDDERSESSKSSDVSSVFSKMSSEDVHYLKEVLGKPLTLALAEITAKKPRDPVHYLGHWLFKYRYNQEIDMIQKQEVEELTRERERIAKEKWHQMIQEEARQAVLEMIMHAEEEAFRNEIEREMRRIAAEAGEEEEDIVGKLPTIGQKTAKT